MDVGLSLAVLPTVERFFTVCVRENYVACVDDNGVRIGSIVNGNVQLEQEQVLINPSQIAHLEWLRSSHSGPILVLVRSDGIVQYWTASLLLIASSTVQGPIHLVASRRAAMTTGEYLVLLLATGTTLLIDSESLRVTTWNAFKIPQEVELKGSLQVEAADERHPSAALLATVAYRQYHEEIIKVQVFRLILGRPPTCKLVGTSEFPLKSAGNFPSIAFVGVTREDLILGFRSSVIACSRSAEQAEGVVVDVGAQRVVWESSPGTFIKDCRLFPDCANVLAEQNSFPIAAAQLEGTNPQVLFISGGIAGVDGRVATLGGIPPDSAYWYVVKVDREPDRGNVLQYFVHSHGTCRLESCSLPLKPKEERLAPETVPGHSTLRFSDQHVEENKECPVATATAVLCGPVKISHEHHVVEGSTKPYSFLPSILAFGFESGEVSVGLWGMGPTARGEGSDAGKPKAGPSSRPVLSIHQLPTHKGKPVFRFSAMSQQEGVEGTFLVCHVDGTLAVWSFRLTVTAPMKSKLETKFIGSVGSFAQVRVPQHKRPLLFARRPPRRRIQGSDIQEADAGKTELAPSPQVKSVTIIQEGRTDKGREFPVAASEVKRQGQRRNSSAGGMQPSDVLVAVVGSRSVEIWRLREAKGSSEMGQPSVDFTCVFSVPSSLGYVLEADWRPSTCTLAIEFGQHDGSSEEVGPFPHNRRIYEVWTGRCLSSKTVMRRRVVAGLEDRPSPAIDPWRRFYHAGVIGPGRRAAVSLVPYVAPAGVSHHPIHPPPHGAVAAIQGDSSRGRSSSPALRSHPESAAVLSPAPSGRRSSSAKKLRPRPLELADTVKDIEVEAFSPGADVYLSRGSFAHGNDRQMLYRSPFFGKRRTTESFEDKYASPVIVDLFCTKATRTSFKLNLWCGALGAEMAAFMHWREGVVDTSINSEISADRLSSFAAVLLATSTSKVRPGSDCCS